MAKQVSTSPAASQSGVMDPLESMLDFSDYDNYHSPSVSPAVASKASFTRPATTASTPSSLLTSSQQMSGPSHQYDLYKQQTGIPAGALASTLAVNQNNSQITGYNNFNLDFLASGSADDLFDFNTDPSQPSLNASDMDMDFEASPADASFFFSEATVNPNSIGGQEPSTLPSPPILSSQTSKVGRLWPGMHQQAALAKAQAQQRQQQQIIRQQQQAQRQAAQQQQHHHVKQQQQQPQRAVKGAQPTDPIVEQKITQLLNSMRAQSASSDLSSSTAPHHNIPRPKKDEDDMDEDERLLASEEGKKLSSKERRQLRNKVSARAFRSRRKEYIGQLEAEIANKVTENGDLRAQNRALVEENKRLSDLTRMLLSSPSFSDFLDRLSSNPQQLPQAQATPQPQLQQEVRQLPKDVNAYASQQHVQQQQIGMAMIPEQAMDFSMLSLDTNDAFNFQPQVYAVFETPEPACTIDASVLSGKTSNFVGEHFDSEDEKVNIPVIERPAPVEKKVKAKTIAPVVVDEEFEADPLFALYHDEPASADADEATVELNTEGLSPVSIFGGIEPEKAFARFELVDVSEDDASVAVAMARVQRISASLESLTSNLELLTVDL